MPDMKELVCIAAFAPLLGAIVAGPVGGSSADAPARTRVTIFSVLLVVPSLSA